MWGDGNQVRRDFGWRSHVLVYQQVRRWVSVIGPGSDAGAASAAGVRCYIIGRAGARGSGWTGVRDYTELRRLLANDAA